MDSCTIQVELLASKIFGDFSVEALLAVLSTV